MCGGFGVLLQRCSYWLGATSPHAAASLAARAAATHPPPPPPPQLTLSAKLGASKLAPRTSSLSLMAAAESEPASPSAAALVAAEAALAPTPAPRRWWRRAGGRG